MPGDDQGAGPAAGRVPRLHVPAGRADHRQPGPDPDRRRPGMALRRGAGAGRPRPARLAGPGQGHRPGRRHRAAGQRRPAGRRPARPGPAARAGRGAWPRWAPSGSWSAARSGNSSTRPRTTASSWPSRAGNSATPPPWSGPPCSGPRTPTPARSWTGSSAASPGTPPPRRSARPSRSPPATWNGTRSGCRTASAARSVSAWPCCSSSWRAPSTGSGRCSARCPCCAPTRCPPAPPCCACWPARWPA